MNLPESHERPGLRVDRRLLFIAAGLSAAYCVGLAFNITSWLRGPQEWRWAYAVPGTLVRLWLPALLLIAYVAAAAYLHRQMPSRRIAIAALLAAAAMAPALQLALLYMDYPDPRSALFYRTVSESSGGFFNVGATVTDTPDFLRHFAERMPGYPVHPQRHPPGLPLLFSWMRQFFDQAPQLAEAISAGLRPYQCHNLALMSLPDAAIASAIAQMAVPFFLGLVAWPIYTLGRALYGESTATGAALLWPLVPSVALWATRWNHLYALFTVLALLAFHAGLSRTKLAYVAASGLTIFLGSFFSFGNLAIAGILGVYAAVWLIARRERPNRRWLSMAAAVFAAGIALPWLLLWLGHGLDFFEIWRAGITTHLGLNRSYTTWLFYHLYDFFVFLGIPLFVFWLSRTASGVRAFLRRHGPVDVLAIAFVAALLLLDLSGSSQGEVARVWAFLLPLPLLIAVSRAPAHSRIFPSLAGLLAAQVFVGNIFLRPVGTGLSDPPSAPPDVAELAASPIATWQNGIALRRAEFPDTLAQGESFQIEVVWSAAQPVSRAYTLFVHLRDDAGRVAAQQDGIPLDGAWPTTCWQPGRSFEDSYRITFTNSLGAGRYHVWIGWYWLPTLERLPVEGSDVTGERTVELGTVVVGTR